MKNLDLLFELSYTVSEPCVMSVLEESYVMSLSYVRSKLAIFKLFHAKVMFDLKFTSA